MSKLEALKKNKRKSWAEKCKEKRIELGITPF
jgi:hypothetical protein